MKKSFIEKINTIAQKGYKEYGILPSLTIAQSILESAWGEKQVGNNIFGIKVGSKWTGEKRLVKTSEYIDGRKIIIEDGFRVYETIEESVEDYLNLIGRLDRYKIVRESSNYKDACENILKAGYATDPNYSHKLVSIIEDNKLYKYDI